jgi:hypothetical protein
VLEAEVVDPKPTKSQIQIDISDVEAIWPNLCSKP